MGVVEKSAQLIHLPRLAYCSDGNLHHWHHFLRIHNQIRRKEVNDWYSYFTGLNYFNMTYIILPSTIIIANRF